MRRRRVSGKRVAIVQSSYVPWKGYFDLIRAADEFILLDEVQFTRRDWRSRNQIKTPRGVAWLTIPVRSKGRYLQSIQDTHVADRAWARTHWALLRTNYRRAPFFEAYAADVEAAYGELEAEDRLSAINHRLIAMICRMLGITTPITWSTDYQAAEGRTSRLVTLCQQAGATEYISGPSARAYIDESQFAAAGVRVRFVDYAGYPEYPQPYPPFAHHVSALDLLFCTGPSAPAYLKDL